MGRVKDVSAVMSRTGGATIRSEQALDRGGKSLADTDMSRSGDAENCPGHYLALLAATTRVNRLVEWGSGPA